MPEPDAAQHETENDRGELGRCAAQILDGLAAEYRSAVWLVDWEGLTQKAAAEQLGLSLSATKSRVQRGRAKLRSALERCCDVVKDGRGRAMDLRRRCERQDCGCEPVAPVLHAEREWSANG